MDGKRYRVTKRVYEVICEVLAMRSDINDHQKVKLELNLSEFDLVRKMTMTKSRSRKI